MGKHHHDHKKKPHVVFNVFTQKERTGWINPFLSIAIVTPCFDPRITFTYAPIFNIHPISAARNLATREFLKWDERGFPGDWLVMADNDVGFPSNWVDCLLDAPEEADIVILPYWVWNDEKNMPVICFGKWSNEMMVTPAPGEVVAGWNEGGAGGTGAMFIRRRVLTDGKMPDPPFKILYDNYEGQKMSEDIWFTSEAHKRGYRIFTHPDYVCSHFHSIDIAKVNFGMCEAVNARMKALEK